MINDDSRLNINQLLNLNDTLILSDILDDTQVALPPMVYDEVVSNPNNINEDLDYDYLAIRKLQLHHLQMLDEVAKIAVEYARNAETPKSIEIFLDLMYKAQIIRLQMLDVHKKTKEIKLASQPTIQQNNIQNNIQNNLYYGTSSDLLNKVGTRQEKIRKENDTIDA